VTGLPQSACAKCATQVDYWLDALEIKGVAGNHPDQLSGGQKQRVA
jgi:molybdate transport system ATP-binding protein